jgi:hypothetical protein
LHCTNPTPCRRSSQRLAFIAAALLSLTVLAVAQPRAAQAVGTYVHLGCVDGNDLADAAGGWQPHLYNMTGISTNNQCSWGGLHAQMNPTSGIPLGATAGWKYTAPPNTNITRFRAGYAGWTKAYDNVNRGLIRIENGAGQVGLNYTDGSATVSNPKSIDWAGLTTNSIDATVICDAPTGHPGCAGSVGWLALFEPTLTLADGSPPVAGTTSGSLTTDATLKGTESFNYAATDSGAGIARLQIWVDGLLTTDHVIDNNNGHCTMHGTDAGDWVFRWPKPCPAAVNSTEALNTTTIVDGQHTIIARAVDASQREATLWTGQRLVANHPPVLGTPPAYEVPAIAAKPIVGTQLVATQGQWSGPSLTYLLGWQRCDAQGANCAQIPGATTRTYVPTADDVGHRLRLSVTATNAADSVTAYSAPTGLVTTPSSNTDPTVKPPADGNDGTDGNNGGNGTNGGNGGNGAPAPPPLNLHSNNSTVAHTFIGRIAGEREGVTCPNDKASLKFQHISGGRLKLRFGKATTAQVQLTCTDTGKAIAGAKLEIATKTGNHPAVAADMTTDGAGHAVLRIAKGPSRGVTVGYRMYTDDPIARATATLRVSVDGRVSLKTNRKTIRNGRVVILRGKLLGGQIPTRGVALAVQWKDGKKWRPFAQIKTNRKGAFAYAYKFTRTNKPLRYQLRVQITKGQVDYPYAAVSSKPVKVKVKP